MYNGTIHIKSVDMARAFVNMTSKHPKLKITLNSNEYSVDGHSIVGILSLDFNHPIEVIAEGEAEDEFAVDLEPFI